MLKEHNDEACDDNTQRRRKGGYLEAPAGLLPIYSYDLIAGELVGMCQKIRRNIDWQAAEALDRSSGALVQKEAAS